METKEKWRHIPGWENEYQASTLGRIKNYNTDDLRQGVITERGILKLILTAGKKRKQCRVARLVALTFIPNPDKLPEIYHKDGDKLNCKPSNLKWISKSGSILSKLRIKKKNKPHYKTHQRILKEKAKIKLRKNATTNR